MQDRKPLAPAAANAHLEERVAELLGAMSVREKIGQMTLADAAEEEPASLEQAIREGRVGSVLNEVDVERVNALQRIAVREGRLAIPLLVGRDVLHGFKTVLPIPLGQAATWNPELVRAGARVAAVEAAAAGINWTFAPMIDVTRDPRWGRIAESFGEDPFLTGVLGAASVKGFQGEDLAAPDAIAACIKHFAGYGASEGGRDYDATNVPENELRNVHLPAFRAAVRAGAASVMTSFGDLDGVPATANRFLLTRVLREEWGFDGFVVSDWGSVEQLVVHGFAPGEKEAALAAVDAGVNLEMASRTYAEHLEALVRAGRIGTERLDALAGAVLRAKLRLGLFESPYTKPAFFPPSGNAEHLAAAKQLALQSMVLLENRDGALPLAGELRSLAVIGPLTDAPYEQLGTWVFDGDPALSRTPLAAIRERAGPGVEVRHVRALETTRSRSTAGFDAAVAAARAADAAILFLGEEAILSGEAHCRADIGLPGAQVALAAAVRAAGVPTIGVVLAGRPLTLGDVARELDALLFAWHPGTMGGPAIAEVLFGDESPSGKLPATFPAMVGQVPIYYAHKNTGKPPTPETFVHIDDIEASARQTSFGMTSFHLDAGYRPRYPFGYGMSYARFSYAGIGVERPRVRLGEPVTVRAEVCNEGQVEAEEVVQCYVRDLFASVTRPVRELKGFERLRLKPGERRTVTFVLRPEDLAFYGRDMRRVTEPGEFHVWIGGSSDADLRAEFTIVDD